MQRVVHKTGVVHPLVEEPTQIASAHALGGGTHRPLVHVLQRPTGVVVVQEFHEQRVAQEIAELAVHDLRAIVDHVVVGREVTEFVRDRPDRLRLSAQIQ